MTAQVKRVKCARCHRRQRAFQNWPEGPVCRTCFRHAAKRRGSCAGCGVDRVLAGLDGNRAGVCVDCAGIPCSFFCATCGSEGEQWFSATCLSCSLQRRLATLLDDGTGQAAPILVPLAWLIITTGRPWARLIWLSRGNTARLLQTLAGGTVAIDHAGLDSLSAGKEVEYLRQLLMGAGIIERRDTQLGNFERWSVRFLKAIDDAEHQRLLRTYLMWKLHRELTVRAANGPLSYSTVAVCRSKANAGLRWLRWMADRGGTVETVTQADLDAWFATASNPWSAADFICWAGRLSQSSRLTLPTHPLRSNSPGPESDRRRLLDELLIDDSINLRERVAGCLVLGLAQSVNRICALSLDDIEDRNGEIFLALGEHPVPLPPRIGVLVSELVSAQPKTDWLFPGNFPGSHLSGRALSRQLSGLGVTRAGRQAALAQLIGTLPAPVVAESLGYTRNTIAIRAAVLGTDWAAYAAAKSRQTANT